MNYNDIQVGDVERLIVSGGFGKHIDYSSAERIGLFPRGLKDRIIYAGNSSLSGAGMILLSSDYALVAEKIADDAKIFTLSNDEYFNHEFINNMKF